MPVVLTIPEVLTWVDPTGETAPVVFDSPHSGRAYPADFDHACPMDELRQAEDSFVDQLFASAPDAGAWLLLAHFPRSYLDVNRAPDDIDPKLLSTPWPLPIVPSEKARLGIGLVRRLCRPGMPMYQRLLTPDEIRHRLDRYYWPYHQQLESLLDDAHGRFGMVWHINCHSMPSLSGITGGRGWHRADFVLGDRDGTTCRRDFTRFVAETLIGYGYSVAINDPYKGVELIRRHGRPGYGRNALQIEVNRKLYINERTLERTAGFEPLAADIGRLCQAITDYARAQATSAMAAD